MIFYHCIRSIYVFMFSLMICFTPIVLAMENEPAPTDQSSNPSRVCSVTSLKKFLSDHGRAVILFLNAGLGGYVVYSCFQQNNGIYETGDLWQGEIREYLRNCTPCKGPMTDIHTNLQEAAFNSDVSTAFLVTSTVGKLLSIGAHFFAGDVLAPYFTLGFLICDGVGAGLGFRANSYLSRASNLVTDAMPSVLREALKNLTGKVFFLAIPTGQAFYELIESGYNCFYLYKDDPSDNTPVENEAVNEQEPVEEQ